ncbi:MAG: replicative DNA helicase [Phycisphaerae bacterium]|nr:replicative DNA helicase [Phycisphaerae bacterium]
MTQVNSQPTNLLERIPPQSVQAERCVLGSMMLDASCIGQVIQLLKREHFVRDSHQALFEGLVSLYDANQGRGIDLVTIRDYLDRKKLFEAIGGEATLVDIVNAVPAPDHAEYYARIVRGKYLLRSLISTSTEILREAFDETEDPTETLDRCEQKIYQLAEAHSEGTGAIELRKLLEDVFDSLSNSDGSVVTGVATGFRELDTMSSGFQPGEMIIIAARPSMGKTALALNIAENMAADNKAPVAFFSLEMSAESLAQRLLASRAEVAGQKLRRRMLSQEEAARLAISVQSLSDAPLFIDDQPGLTVMQLRARARRLKTQRDVKAIFIDYLQLMDAPGGRDISRQQQISDISRGLKALARELKVPVIALSQLNRQAEGREGHRPRMSDLRESGSLEQDADVVLLLHREEYYHIGEGDVPEEIRGVAEVIVAKQRNGPTGTIKLQFNNQITRFRDLAEGIPAAEF